MDDELKRGFSLYRRFNQFDPERVFRIRHARVIPSVVVELGDLLGLIYRSDKGRHGKDRPYIHVMEDPPRLVCDVSGSQLYIIGGSYSVTPHGIEG